MATVLNEAAYDYSVRGDGPPLLLLHGFTGSQANWDEIVTGLAPDFQVISVDLLGHGRSAAPADPARYQMHHAAADLLALCDHLQLERVHLLGYSMGGRLALYTAVQHPHRIHSLILESSSPGLATVDERNQRQAQDNELAAWIEANGIEPFVAKWEALPLWQNQQAMAAETRERLRTLRLQNQPTGLANSLRGMGTGAQPSMWPYLARLPLPVLQIVGQLDSKFVNINAVMAEVIANTQLELVPGAGHMVHWERPLAYQQLIIDWLRKRET